ncbi:AI-2E family transporter [Desulfobacterales bacterium HSG16]|nr:AI-2E family transporter [Desulfobacterales bacterium HSG16]
MSEFRIADPLMRRMVYAISAMLIVTFGFYTFNLLKPSLFLVLVIVKPFGAALLLAYILAPVVITLQKQLKMGRIMGTLMLYFIIFIVVFLLLVFLIPTFLSEFIRLFQTIKAALPGLLNHISQSEYFQIDPKLIHIIQEEIRTTHIDYEKIAGFVLPGLKNVAAGGFEAVGIATKGIFSSVGAVVGFFSFFIFVGIINFYIIVDWEKIRPMIRKIAAPSHRVRLFDIMKKMDIAVGGFLRGQLTVSMIVGGMFAAGLFFMGFIGFPALRNYCVLIGSAAAIGGFIPYLGALIGVTPAIIIVILTGGVTWTVKLVTLLAVLALFSLIQAVEGFILQPRIVGKGAGLHPLMVMLALIAGAQFGIAGMIAAVPLASIIRVLVIEFYWLPLERREEELIRETLEKIRPGT